MGKGSSKRPMQVPHGEYSKNWDRTFGELRRVPASEWLAKRRRKEEPDLCPCDDPVVESCMCKGACSCHWRQ